MRFAKSVFRGLYAGGSVPAVARQAMIEGLECRCLMSASLSSTVVTSTPVTTPVVVPTVKSIGVLIHSEAGESFTGLVGRVHGLPITSSTAAGYQAVINWGDASTADSKGTIYVTASGNIAIGGTHTYSAAGKYTITITVETKPPVLDPPTAMIAPLVLATVKSTAEVSSDKEGGVHLIETATQKFTASLGTFDFKNVDLGFSATITWGDGTTSTGVVQRVPGADFDDWQVIGTHTYSTTRHYKIFVGVTARPIGFPPGVKPPIILYIASIHSTADVYGHA